MKTLKLLIYAALAGFLFIYAVYGITWCIGLVEVDFSKVFKHALSAGAGFAVWVLFHEWVRKKGWKYY
jgi:NADH:ubiquinone oxidoreductase subunit 4 (subunit M)